MANDAPLVVFSWPVATGYRWEDFPTGTRGRAQRHRLLCSDPGAPSVYHPLVDEPQLFLDLADLETTEEGVLGFATKRGLLGLVPALPRAVAEEVNDPHAVETLSDWREEVQHLRRAADLARAVVAGDEESLRGWFRFRADGSARYRYRGPGERLVTHGRVEPGALVQGDPERAARLLVLRTANDVLERHASAQLLFDTSSGEVGLHVVPDSLLGSAWVQLAQYVEGGREFRRCERCRKWFLASPDGRKSKRADSRYCSDSCRVRAHQLRMKEAQRMRAEGATPSAIAKALDSKTETVRGWLNVKPPRAKTRRRSSTRTGSSGSSTRRGSS